MKIYHVILEWEGLHYDEKVFREKEDAEKWFKERTTHEWKTGYPDIWEGSDIYEIDVPLKGIEVGVYGGVAEVMHNPDGIPVEIYDFDVDGCSDDELDTYDGENEAYRGDKYCNRS